MYCRTPGGLLVELAWTAKEAFLIDEPASELGTHMCIPPHWEHRRAEIAQLEPIDTIETVLG
jgi:glyoxalase family protein